MPALSSQAPSDLTVNESGRLNASSVLVAQACKLILATTIVSIAVVPLFVPQDEWLKNVVPPLAFMSVYLLSWRLADRGYPAAGAHVFLWGTFAGQIGVLYSTANLEEQALVSGVNLVLAAGFMLGRKASAVAGIVYALTLIMFRFAWSQGWFPPGELMASESMRLVALLSTIMGTIGLTYIGIRNMTGAVIAARAHAERAEVAAQSLQMAREAEARRATRAERLGSMARSLVSLRQTSAITQEVAISLREALDAHVVLVLGRAGRVLSIAGLGQQEPPAVIDGLDIEGFTRPGEVSVMGADAVEGLLGQLSLPQIDAEAMVARGPHTSIGLVMVAHSAGFDVEKLSWSVQVAANLMDAAILRIESEHRLVQVQKMDALSRLSAGIAHDFNNLLTTILGGAEILEHRAVQSDPIHGRLRNIREAGERAASLTSKLMSFTRSLPRQSRAVDLSVLVSDLQPVLRRTVEENIQVEFIESEEPVWVDVDPMDIERVVLNLVANARDALGDRGRIDLGVETRANPGEHPKGVLWVQDNGEGMDVDTRTRVFEPFFTTRQGKGATGLGLSIVYGVIQALNGEVFIDSAKTKGTCVEVHLPLREPSIAPDPIHPLPVKVANGTLILVVEDDPDVRDTVCELLELGGYTTRSVGSVNEALEALGQDESICLVLADVVMPDMGGFDLAKAMEERDVQTPIALISGYAPSHDDRTASLPRITKPFSLTDLLGFVAQHVSVREVSSTAK